jgi:glycosyltransferase involved in cell wall biosynthesis
MKYVHLDDISVESDAFPTEVYRPLVRSSPLAECEICAIVPVRNEAALLAACLSALAAQVDLDGRPFDFRRYEVILLTNNCTDDSVAIAQRFAQQHPQLRLHLVDRFLPPSAAYIGRVRQMLMDEAYHRLAGLGLAGLGGRSGIIASTDGDSRVAPTWLAATQLEMSRGADAVGGRIIADPDSCQALDPQVRSRYLLGDDYHQLRVELEAHLDLNPHDRWPRHAQHYGASLAVTAQMYRQAGGLPAVRTPEDVAFYRALMRVGARFRHSPLVQVTTSARQTVRTEGGFAAQLNQWAAMGQQQAFLVEPAAAIEVRIQTRRQLRELWRRMLNGYQHSIEDVSIAASTLGICANWLWTELTQPQSFELLFERVEVQQIEAGVWGARWPSIDLEQAIGDLHSRLRSLRPSG